MEYLDLWGCEQNGLKIDLDKFLDNLKKLQRFEMKFECKLFIIPRRYQKKVFYHIEIFQINFKIDDSIEEFLMILKM